MPKSGHLPSCWAARVENLKRSQLFESNLCPTLGVGCAALSTFYPEASQVWKGHLIPPFQREAPVLWGPMRLQSPGYRQQSPEYREPAPDASPQVMNDSVSSLRQRTRRKELSEPHHMQKIEPHIQFSEASPALISCYAEFPLLRWAYTPPSCFPGAVFA